MGAHENPQKALSLPGGGGDLEVSPFISKTAGWASVLQGETRNQQQLQVTIAQGTGSPLPRAQGKPALYGLLGASLFVK